jgi:hypothetical protein
MAQHPHNEALFEQYKVTAAEMGISDLHAEDEFNAPKTLRLFIAHANATVAQREAYKAWRSWNGGRTKTEFAKEERRLKNLHLQAEYEKACTFDALQLALLGEAWVEFKRAKQEEEAAEFEAQLQADFEADLGEDFVAPPTDEEWARAGNA